MNINEITRQMLIDQANKDMAKWPQYKGKFDYHTLFRVKKNVKTKMGLAFTKGEIAIGSYNENNRSYVLYSVRNKCETALPLNYIEEVA